MMTHDASDSVLFADLEGKTDLKIRALEIVEELRIKRADKQVSVGIIFRFIL